MARLTTFDIEGTRVAADYLRDLSFAIDDQLNGRSTVECQLVDPLSEYRPAPRDVLVVGMDDVTVFGGVLWDQDEDNIGGPGTGTTSALVFVDYTALLDVVYINAPIGAGTLASQLAILIANMAPHGVVLSGDQEPGPDMAAQLFAFQTIREAVDALSTQSGWVYTIDPTGAFLMVEPGTIPAPFTISEDLGNYRSLRWNRNLNAYRNEGWARYGSPGVQIITDVLSGDGANRTFPLSRALVLSGGSVTSTGLVTVTRTGPSVSNETIDADIGGSAQWHYDAGSNSVVHDEAQTVLGSGETVSISYAANSPGTVFYRDDVEYAEFGPFTIVLDYPDVTDPIVALAMITGEVNRRVGLSKRVQLVLDTPGVRPGMTLPIDVPSRDCVGEYFVLSTHTVEEVIQATDIEDDAGERFYRFEHELVEGNKFRKNWEPFWKPDPAASTGGPTLTPPAVTPTPDYPFIRSTSSNRTTSDTTSHAIGMPTHVAGDLLLVVFSNDDDSAVTIDGGSSPGWSELATALGSVSLVRGSVFTAEAPSAATTLTLNTAAAQQSSWVVYAIRVGTFSGADASSSFGGGSDSDAPNHVPSPGGTPNYLWLVARCGDSSFTASAPPSGFTNQITIAGTVSGASTDTAQRVAAVSALDPSPWTSASPVSWVCFTIAVWPA